MNQRQSSGDHSFVIQSGGDTTVVQVAGLSHADARQIAIDVYKANALTLAEQAASIAMERVRHFADRLIDRQQQSGRSAQAFHDPGFLRTLYEAERAYSETGDEELADLLLELVAERSGTATRGVAQLVVEQCVITAPKLSSRHLDVLAALVLLSRRNASVTRFDELSRWLHRHLDLLRSVLPVDDSTWMHLAFAQCLSQQPGHVPTNAMLFDAYKDTFGGESVAAQNLLPEASQLHDAYWRSFSLTSVGVALGYARACLKADIELRLESYLKEG